MIAISSRQSHTGKEKLMTMAGWRQASTGDGGCGQWTTLHDGDCALRWVQLQN